MRLVRCPLSHVPGLAGASMNPALVKLTALIAASGFLITALQANAAVPAPGAVAAARTPAEHEAIAKAYESEAKSLERLAAMHKSLGQTYGQPGGKPWQRG